MISRDNVRIQKILRIHLSIDPWQSAQSSSCADCYADAEEAADQAAKQKKLTQPVESELHHSRTWLSYLLQCWHGDRKKEYLGKDKQPLLGATLG